MGRALLIIVAGVILVTGMVQISLHNVRQLAMASTMAYANQTQSRNIANSGMEIALNKIYEDKNWRDGYSPFQIGEGYVEILVDDQSSLSELAANQLRLSAKAWVHDDTVSIWTTMAFDGGTPPAKSPMGVYSNNLDVSVSGTSFSLNGNDQNLDGTPGNEPALPGLVVGGENSYNNVYANLTSGQLDNIVGAGGNSSVENQDIVSSDLQSYIQQYVDNADTTITSNLNSTTLGTDEDPQVTVINGSIDISSVQGSGIMVVGAGNSIRITGNFDYHGLIILQGDTQFEADIYGNTNVHGAVMMGATDSSATFDLDLRGNVAINYSSQALGRLEMDLSQQIDSQLSEIYRFE